MPLTALGVNQANDLASKLKDAGLMFDKVYCSPATRARQTAEIISSRLELPKPTNQELLIERDFGVMTGKPIKDIETLCAPDIIKTSPVIYFLSALGCETFPDLIIRAKEFLAWIDSHDNSENLLVVTHGDTGKMIYAAYYDLPWKDVLGGFHFGNSEALLLAPDINPEEGFVFRLKQYNY